MCVVCVCVFHRKQHKQMPLRWTFLAPGCGFELVALSSEGWQHAELTALSDKLVFSMKAKRKEKQLHRRSPSGHRDKRSERRLQKPICKEEQESVFHLSVSLAPLAQLTFRETHTQDWRELVDFLKIKWIYAQAVAVPVIIPEIHHRQTRTESLLADLCINRLWTTWAEPVKKLSWMT